MRTVAAVSVLAVSLASQVAATIYVTSPIATTTCTANTQCLISWNDDGQAPVLSTIGPCQIDLCTGGQVQQTCLQNVTPSLDVSQNAQVTFNPNPTIGPDSNEYFIKFTSLSYMDPTNPAYHYESYSAKFTLAGMTGTFNATIESEISMVPAATSAAAVGTVATNAVPSFLATTTPKPATTTVHTVASTASTTKKSGAVAVTVPSVVSSVTGITVVMGFLGMLAFGL